MTARTTLITQRRTHGRSQRTDDKLMVRSVNFLISIRDVTDQQHRLHDLHVEHAGEAHSESLRLQRTVRDRFASRNGKRGKRRKAEVIDLNVDVMTARRRHGRLLFTLLWLETAVALGALIVLALYVFSQRGSIF